MEGGLGAARQSFSIQFYDTECECSTWNTHGRNTGMWNLNVPRGTFNTKSAAQNAEDAFDVFNTIKLDFYFTSVVAPLDDIHFRT